MRLPLCLIKAQTEAPLRPMLFCRPKASRTPIYDAGLIELASARRAAPRLSLATSLTASVGLLVGVIVTFGDTALGSPPPSPVTASMLGLKPVPAALEINGP